MRCYISYICGRCIPYLKLIPRVSSHSWSVLECICIDLSGMIYIILP